MKLTCRDVGTGIQATLRDGRKTVARRYFHYETVALSGIFASAVDAAKAWAKHPFLMGQAVVAEENTLHYRGVVTGCRYSDGTEATRFEGILVPPDVTLTECRVDFDGPTPWNSSARPWAWLSVAQLRKA